MKSWRDSLKLQIHKDFLAEIITLKKKEIEEREKMTPISILKKRAASAPPAMDFAGALKSAAPVAIIAEIKKASPSAGEIRPEADAREIARAYQKGGASALSVLTEEIYFHGALSDIEAAKIGSRDLPVLRKDFIISPYQVYESRAAGADSILLIVAANTKSMLKELLALGKDLGMSALVEVHNEAEIETALEMDAELIGVNNRNLHTLKVDGETCLRLSGRIPQNKIAVAESGVKSHEGVLALKEAGYRAVLVGEYLMRQKNIAAAVKELLR